MYIVYHTRMHDYNIIHMYWIITLTHTNSVRKSLLPLVVITVQGLVRVQRASTVFLLCAVEKLKRFPRK